MNMNRISKGLGLLFLLIIVISGCKSQKKAKEAQAQQAEPKEVVTDEKPETTVTAPKIEEVKPEPDAKKKEMAMKLNGMFASVATSGNKSASEATKKEILNMFSSGNVPVLIVIYDGEKVKDHDKPTTISSYVDYLSLTGNNNAQVENIELNDQGLITLLELKKNYTNN